MKSRRQLLYLTGTGILAAGISSVYGSSVKSLSTLNTSDIFNVPRYVCASQF